MGKINTRSFDMANYLQGEQDVMEYLRQVLQEGDPVELGAALGDIARARGMSQLASDKGLSRESLYKSLSGERAPSSATLFKVMKALGFKLTIEPLGRRRHQRDAVTRFIVTLSAVWRGPFVSVGIETAAGRLHSLQRLVQRNYLAG